MAKRSSNKSSSGSFQRRRFAGEGSIPSIRSTCYDVEARSGALRGFHYSTTGAGGRLRPKPTGPSGVPEVGSGLDTPPSSPPRTTWADGDLLGECLGREEGATYTITGECERLFCDTMRAVFLGEGKTARNGSLVLGTGYKESVLVEAGSLQHRARRKATVRHWLEIWDYVGGSSFRGFVADVGNEKSMFVFFERSAIDQDLKPGLMSIIDLASSSHFDCSAVVVCLDRTIGAKSLQTLIRDLGWVGFELATLDAWTGNSKSSASLSSKWLFVALEL